MANKISEVFLRKTAV